jgi:hypothetical protein
LEITKAKWIDAIQVAHEYSDNCELEAFNASTEADKAKANVDTLDL